MARNQWTTGLCTFFAIALIALFALPASGEDLNIAVGDEIGTEDQGTSLSRSFSVKIFNSSPGAVSSISLKVLDASAGIHVVDDTVIVSSVEANNYVISDDGFTLSVERGTRSSGEAIFLHWLVDYTDAAGAHQQVVETVSAF